MFKFLNSISTFYITQKTINLFFKCLKKNEILFIILFNDTKKLENNIFANILNLKKYKVINKWSNGLITNFYQFCKSFNNKESYSVISSIDFNLLNYIFLVEIPEKHTSMFKELLFLKKNLNIKIISLVDISNKNIDSSFVDIPLYFSSEENFNNNPDKKSLIFYILSVLK
jgi:hypothetical protein